MGSSNNDIPPQKKGNCLEYVSFENAIPTLLWYKKTNSCYKAISKLSTLDCNFVLHKKHWCQILLDKYGAHHTIVLSDGIKKEIILDYRSSTRKLNAIANLPFPAATCTIAVLIETYASSPLLLITGCTIANILEVITQDYLKQAKLNIEEFTGDVSQLEKKGTVERTYDELKAIAKKILNNNPRYYTFSFNSQHFCQEFILETT